MEGSVPVDPDQDDDANKLIPEWGRDGDDQVVLIGLAVVAALALGLAWQALAGGAGDREVSPDPSAVESVVSVESVDELGGGADEERFAPTTTSGPAPAAPSVAADPTDVPAPDVDRTTIDGVREAVGSLPGRIEVAADGPRIILTGFVANDAERRRAEQAATAVARVVEVGNELVSLEPEVTRALSEHGVAGATAIGRGTSITVSGTVGSPDERTAALAAARAVEGVTEIIDDRLNLEVVTALNALPQVGFATGSARISAASRPVLDRAAQLLRTAGAVSIEIRGYTDTRGSTARNLLLSQARAEAARTQLVERGVGEATLTATGLGETEQFGEEPEANRVVRFSQIDG